ncbi:MAG: hypothetical protein J7L58_02625 [Thermoplasmata archaeon]|nr:hypothetical protein [Thermoplasmata archaeon]
MDLKINGCNFLNNALIKINKAKPNHMHYIDIPFMVDSSTTAFIKLKFSNLSSCSDEISRHIEIGMSIKEVGSGNVYVVLDINEHKTLWDLQDIWLNLTNEKFKPREKYILNVSIYPNLFSSCKGKEVAFDIWLIAEQEKDGFSDMEISCGNKICIGGGNGC